MRDILHLRRPGALVWLLLAATLFMRSVMPTGYMPERTEAGTITVGICNGDGVWQIPLAPRDAKPETGHEKPAPCAFAALASPATPAPDVAVVLPVAAPAIAPRPYYGTGTPIAAVRTLPPARGPPLPV